MGRRNVAGVVVGIILALVSLSGHEASPHSAAPTVAQEAGATLPVVSGQVTFLYFNDIDRAAKFYSETLGLKSTFDRGWVRIYAVSPSSFVGLVSGTEGMLRPASDKPVMVSLVVDDVDGWYAALKARGVSIATPPEDGSRVPVRAFSFKDPEGYTLEVFSWLKK